MFLFRIDLARMKWRLGCALLVLALPLVMGGWMVHDSYEQELKNDASASASKARTLLERMLDQAERANLEVLPLAGRSCSDNLLLLRKRVALEPFLRSINLVRQGIINCTSLFGPAREVDDGSRYTDRKLLLMSGNLVRKNHPLLVVRQERGRDAALSAIDSSQLSFMLTLSSDPSELFLQVGSAWLDESGHFQSDPPKLHSKFALILASQRYPFTIHAGYAMPIYWRALWEARHLQLIWLGASSLVLSLLVWWLLGRPGALTDELRRGLRAREFVPYLQPLIASKGGKMVGAEVLMRWQHATEGLIRPDLFIPQAEESGLIVPMTVNLMKTVAKTLHPVQEQLPEAFHISFNISAIHCRDLSLVAECRDFLGHFVPGRVVLVLELTERELLVTSPQTLSLFRQLDEMGVQLAIDDFGTGHSSLIYLQQFHVDYLKIDRSFIGRIGTESLSEHIVDNVIDLGGRLGLSLVAEGVETEQQAAYLRGKGVQYLQGYLFARPMPIRQFCRELTAGEIQVAAGRTAQG
ncbi:EAL domain-containing protein [Aeromonas caviae]|uniref:EAL domain-containing protein n=1 Tax=Aeromonas caviae TaxID=648 RepID=UPI0015DECAFF|nr:cyclic diguanylate phosphodiesterase [Aeromonas caviae]MDH1633767.1 cyclic diguanylate phosphodiesterase [Aeromonas caviae]MDX7675275.1 cyclic diguanylate phosphodiesterase [Aeromonas caviae]QLL87224.1 EAL domain-containing protein [Aeromonas caviae]